MRRQTTRRRRALFAFAAVILSAGCGKGLRSNPTDTTQPNRLMTAYTELSTGRFWVLADFEDLKHNQLFSMDGHSPQAECSANLDSGIASTGRKCLRFVLADPEDALVIDNEAAVNWFMKRDWREFHLLMASVHCPVEALRLDVTLEAGRIDDTAEVRTRVNLNKGWNRIRLDLVELADHLPIDDVRRIRLSSPDVGAPTVLFIDDVVLVDNRKEILGSSEQNSGQLYVVEQGRRWNVGVPGRFELGLANGQIVHWFDLSSDPNRLENLVAGAVLGPCPVVMPDFVEKGAFGRKADFAEWGEAVRTRQRLIEAVPGRVIVACEWRFGDGSAEIGPDSPFQRWSYVIYPDGRIYVYAQCGPGSASWSPQNVGLATCLASRADLQTYAHLGSSADSGEVSYAFARPSATDKPGLLMALRSEAGQENMEVVDQPDLGRTCLLAVDKTVDSGMHQWTCLLSIWPPGNCVGDLAEQTAADFVRPPPLRPTVGRSITNSPGDLDSDGFDERLGCYLFQPEGDLLRLTVDGAQQPRVNPTICVVGTKDRQVWVYVDNVIVERVDRDSGGNLLFTVPGVVRQPRLIEVILRKPEA